MKRCKQETNKSGNAEAFRLLCKEFAHSSERACRVDLSGLSPLRCQDILVEENLDRMIAFTVLNCTEILLHKFLSCQQIYELDLVSKCHVVSLESYGKLSKNKYHLLVDFRTDYKIGKVSDVCECLSQRYSKTFKNVLGKDDSYITVHYNAARDTFSVRATVSDVSISQAQELMKTFNITHMLICHGDELKVALSCTDFVWEELI